MARTWLQVQVETLASATPIEPMIECAQRSALKRWQSGEMALSSPAAGMLEGERELRRIIGDQQLATRPWRSGATCPPP